MILFARIKKFTFLELMAAVIIFLIVSVVITAVYRTALNAYKRGGQYSDISQNLSGTLMVMEHDLKNIVTINDKESVFFEPSEFSFIAIAKNKNNYSYLEQIKFSIMNEKLLRSSVRYPENKINIDREPVLFLDNLDDTEFKYIYKKENKNKNKSENKSNENNSENKDNEEDDQKDKGSEISKDSDSDSDIKIPIGITIAGSISNENLKKDFETTLSVPLFIIQKMPKSDKKNDKNSDKKKSNNANKNEKR